MRPVLEVVPENLARVPKVQGGVPPNLSGKRTEQAFGIFVFVCRFLFFGLLSPFGEAVLFF